MNPEELPIRVDALHLLDKEEREAIQYIKTWWNDPMANGGFLETLQDAGPDIIRDLCEFLERYSNAYNALVERARLAVHRRGLSGKVPIVTATKSIGAAITLDEVDVCRDETCSIIEVHAAHEIRSARGAPPKLCPSCGETIPRGQGAYCAACGWDRRGPTFKRRVSK